jgi:hypothetical protein
MSERIGLFAAVDSAALPNEIEMEQLQFTMRALKAMVVFVERRMVASQEPVKYQDKVIDGFALMMNSGNSMLTSGAMFSQKDMVRAIASLCTALRDDMPSSVFYDLLIHLYRTTKQTEDEIEKLVVCTKGEKPQ